MGTNFARSDSALLSISEHIESIHVPINRLGIVMSYADKPDNDFCHDRTIVLVKKWDGEFVTWEMDDTGNTYNGHHFGDTHKGLELAVRDFNKRCGILVSLADES